MLSHATYKLIHLGGIFLLIFGLGGVWALVTAASKQTRTALHRLLMALHGAAMLVILVGGFGMMARLQISHQWPTWIWIKLVIWLLLAALPALMRRRLGPAGLWLLLAPLLATIAAYAAIFRIGQIP